MTSRSVRRVAAGEEARESRKARDARTGATRDIDPEGDTSQSRAPWLLTAKVTAPDPADGYFHRPALIRQLDPVANRRVSVLRAPGGFGKTTTLAEIGRRAKKRGLLVAWLTVDEDDAPGLFGAHLAYAFEHAGLDLAMQHSEDAWSASPLTHQIGMLVRTIESRVGSCLLVLDELERLPGQSVALLERLLRRGPRNLHFALSFRTNPGLDLASVVLEDSAVVVSTEQLRFSKPEIARFFGGDLTRRELNDIADRTAGWPVALRIDRSMRAAGTAASIERGKALTRNFLDARLLRGLSDQDRALLLDLAVFDWVDTELADEVLESTDTRLRVEALLALDGLLVPVDPNGAVWRLHPLLREHCIRRLAAQDPVRKKRLHRGIAEALARRGHMIPAWRHAGETGDRRFLGEMMERVGVFQMWLREGMTCLAAADRFLTPMLLDDFPRLALIRCVARRLRLQFEEARTLFQATKPKLDDLARRRDADVPALLIDCLFTEVTLVGAHSRLASSGLNAAFDAGSLDPATLEQAPLALHGLHLSGCVSSYDAASFEMCRQRGLEVLSFVARNGFRHGEIFVSVYLGLAAMARGRVEEAASRYADVRRVTKAFFPSDAALATITDALVLELDIERDREKAIEERTVTGLTDLRGAWIEVHETAIAVAAELTCTRHDPQAAIEFLTDEITKVRAMGLAKIVRYASAMLSFVLAEAGCPGRAEQVWQDEQLPTDAAGLLDLDGQSWREMEALSCARIRLLTELGDRDVARDLANRLRGIASQRGLRRTLMRALALSMTIDAPTDRAIEPLVEFLRLTRATDYLRPLVRHRDVSRDLLTRLLDQNPEPEIRETAASVLAHLDGPRPPSVPVFSPREQAVLVELRNGLRNREIADRLGVTEDGVRHHLKSIYRKTGTVDRGDAVRRATSMGARF